jgi:hypothetical protein
VEVTHKITIDEVLDAKMFSKLKFVQCETFDYLDQCGCPLAHLFIYNNKISPESIKSADEIFNWANITYGESYSLGFINGFDEHKDMLSIHIQNKDYKENYDNGYKNGVYIREKLIELQETIY